MCNGTFSLALSRCSESYRWSISRPKYGGVRSARQAGDVAQQVSDHREALAQGHYPRRTPNAIVLGRKRWFGGCGGGRARDGPLPSPDGRSHISHSRGLQILLDAVANARRGRLHGIAGKVGVAGGRLDLGVTEQLADHRQSLAER